MATPQTVIHGNTRTRDAVVLLSVLGLAMLQLWELPRQAAQHGGLAFVGAWLVGVLLLTLPVLLMELMLGRRSRRSPLEGLAVLTREADARRFWRVGAWGGALAALLALAAVALLAGGSINFLAHDLGLVGDSVGEVSAAGLALPLGSGFLLLVAAGLALLAQEARTTTMLVVFIAVLVLLGLAALAGVGVAEVLYKARALSAAEWRAAFRLALLSQGTGLGVIWVGGMRLPRETSLGKLALGLLAIQLLLAVLLLLALAPFTAAALIQAQSGLQVVPSGISAWSLLGALILLAWLTLSLLAEPVLLRLVEKGLTRLQAVVAVFVVAAVVAEAVWLFWHDTGLRSLVTGLGLLLLLVLLDLAIFSGWAMKISHARKELALPAEGLYNLWRVAIRLVVPLAILWVLAGYFY